MIIFFEFIKGLFMVLTILLGVLLIRGDDLFSQQPETLILIKEIFLPGYLVFCGLICGYLIAHVRSTNVTDEGHKKMILMRSFMIGIGLGVAFAIAHIFLNQ